MDQIKDAFEDGLRAYVPGEPLRVPENLTKEETSAYECGWRWSRDCAVHYL